MSPRTPRRRHPRHQSHTRSAASQDLDENARGGSGRVSEQLEEFSPGSEEGAEARPPSLPGSESPIVKERNWAMASIEQSKEVRGVALCAALWGRVRECVCGGGGEGDERGESQKWPQPATPTDRLKRAACFKSVRYRGGRGSEGLTIFRQSIKPPPPSSLLPLPSSPRAPCPMFPLLVLTPSYVCAYVRSRRFFPVAARASPTRVPSV